MGDVDDVPPLEDMSSLVDQIKDKQQSNSISEVKVSSSNNKETFGNPPLVKEKNANVGYGGLRKGFLVEKSKPKSTSKPLTKSTVKVDYDLKPKKNQSSNLVFNEVQENMKDDYNLLGGGQWITPDLLKNIEGNEKLLRRLNDPKFSKAVEMMQKDPRAAMEYYKDQLDVQEFFQEFFKVLGAHFINLGDKTETSQKTNSSQKSEEEIQFEKTISDPAIQTILSKSSIRNLFTVLKSNPEEGQHLFRTANDSLKADVEKLIEAGLLSFESMPGKR